MAYHIFKDGELYASVDSVYKEVAVGAMPTIAKHEGEWRIQACDKGDMPDIELSWSLEYFLVSDGQGLDRIFGRNWEEETGMCCPLYDCFEAKDNSEKAWWEDYEDSLKEAEELKE